VSWVLGGPGQKLTGTEICKKIQLNLAQTHGGLGLPTGLAHLNSSILL